MSEKSEEKGDRGTEGETTFPTQAMEALIGDEEQTGEKRRKNKERNRDWTSNPGLYGRLLWATRIIR